jgi:hypothetical protein
LELKWVAQASVAAAHSKLQDRASSFWKSLWDSPSLNSALILLSQRQSIALRALLDMRAKSATPVVAALGRVLGTDGTTAALNRRLPDALASLERFAMLVLFGLLIDRIWESPARWLARVTELTSASMDAMPAVGVSNRSRNRDATPLELTAKRLAELNTEALAAVLDENSSTEVIDSVCQRLFSSELSARSGAELGSALVSACRDDVASNKLATVALYPTTRGALVDMLYHMTQALLRMPMANPVCVARLMLDITAAVRTKLGSVLRRQYLEHARAWLEYMHAQRDRQADRAAGAEMRKSIQALQIVLRSLRGIEPVGAVQP